MKNITPQEFLALPLSQAIRKVLGDIQSIEFQGITLDMDKWWRVDRGEKRPCTVCFAGAALCAFALDNVNGYDTNEFGVNVLNISNSDVAKITRTFDALRSRNLIGAHAAWNSKLLERTSRGLVWWAEDICRSYKGLITFHLRNHFIREMNRVADLFESVGS